MQTVAIETRNQAYQEIKDDGSALTNKERVYECICLHGPVSDMEIARLLGSHVRGPGARRNELCGEGRVIAATNSDGTLLKGVEPTTGKRVTLWVVTPAANQPAKQPDLLTVPDSALKQTSLFDSPQTIEPSQQYELRSYGRKVKRENPCVALYGAGEVGVKCSTCKLLVEVAAGRNFYKCRLRSVKGSSTDHNKTWPACGKYEAGKPSLYDGR